MFFMEFFVSIFCQNFVSKFCSSKLVFNNYFWGIFSSENSFRKFCCRYLFCQNLCPFRTFCRHFFRILFVGKTPRHFDTSGSLGFRDIAMAVFCGSAGGILYCSSWILSSVQYLASRYIDDIPSPSSTRLHFMTAYHENTIAL